MLPNFLLVGAMKSGTTSIYNYLSEHPQIFVPYEKEPRFFTSSALIKIENAKYNFQKFCTSKPVDNIDDYKSLFSNVGNEPCIGEASPHYLFTHETTIPLIKKYLGDVKIILILRNPVDRAFSAYKHNRSYDPVAPHLYEKLSFDDALKAERERLRTGDFPMMYYYKSLGLYYEQVKAYKSNFTDVFVCTFEELESDPLLLMKNIYTFLRVDNDFKPNVKIKYNISRTEKLNFLQRTILYFFNPSNKELKLYLTRIMGKKNLQRLANILFKQDDSRLDDQTRSALKDEFREDILKLEKLVDKDLSSWLSPG